MKKFVLLLLFYTAIIPHSYADVFQNNKNIQVVAMNEYHSNYNENNDNNVYFFINNSHSQSINRKSVGYYKTNYYSNNFSHIFKEIGYKFHIDPRLLYAIAVTESSLNPEAVNYNTNGTYDYGLMQINSCHLPTLQKYGITKDSLFNPKVNIEVGAWILSKCISKYGYSWNAVACYHTGSGNVYNKEAMRYIWQVYNYIR